MTRTEAQAILYDMTKGESLRRHAKTVEIVMEALAHKLGEDPDKFAITGMLHDADYEAFPEQHPSVIVQKLEEMGETEIAYAIKGHYTKWGVPHLSTLDKCIVAADELTGFIIAASLLRPTKLQGMKVKSVTKKLKNPKFAASVDREEVRKGAELIGWELNDLIAFIIDALSKRQEELGL